MVLEENQVSSMYYDGPPTRQWEVVTEACIFVQRAGCDDREKERKYIMPMEFFVPLDLEDADKAAYLAARLNDLDAARARIALLEARLEALCGAVEVCRDDDDLEWLDVFDSNVAALLSAKQAAREVLGG